MTPRPNSPKLSSEERPNTIGLQTKPLEALLEFLDHPEDAKNVARRQFSRWPFRQATIRVTISHPGGSTVVLKLACRNISRGGIGLLHTSFVHPGSSCRVELPNINGGMDRIDAVIQRCSHRRGTLHELGIKFRQPIDMDRYVGRSRGGWSPSLEHVVPDRLAGTVLYAEPCMADLEAFQVAIKDTSIRLRHVRTGAEVLGQPLGEIALVAASLKLPDMNGVELLTKLRKDAPRLPVLLLSDQPLGAAAEHMQDASCALVQKPVPGPMLLRILAEWTLTSGRPADAAQPAAGGPGAGPVKNPPTSAAA